jgi:predicted Zn-dependent protease
MPPPPHDLAAADEMLARLERLIAASPADSTEAAWVEVRRGEAASGADAPSARRERTILIRVRQSGRTGLHRTGSSETSDLENAVRDALAQARLAAPTPHEALAGPGDASGGGSSGGLHDPALAALAPPAARALLLDAAPRRGETLHLKWLEGRVAVANSAGARRLARVTAAACTVHSGGPGGGAGAGSARMAARHLDGLGLASALERARQRQAPAGQEPAECPATAPVMVLSEQGAAALLDLFNRHALSTAAWRDGSPASWPRALLGERVAAPCISLRDDATLPEGLAFPFDLAGWPKRPVDLLAAGIFLTPAVDARLAAEIGRSPTPHAVAPDESLAANLVLWPGAGGTGGDPAQPRAPHSPLAETDLLRAAEGGLWIGELAGGAAFDAARLCFRATARGVRRIGGGELREALPDLVWEDSLAALLAGALALGDRPAAIATGDPLFGATLTPLLALRTTGHLQPTK